MAVSSVPVSFFSAIPEVRQPSLNVQPDFCWLFHLQLSDLHAFAVHPKYRHYLYEVHECASAIDCYHSVGHSVNVLPSRNNR